MKTRDGGVGAVLGPACGLSPPITQSECLMGHCLCLRKALCGPASATPQVPPCVPAHLHSKPQVLAQGPPQPRGALDVWGPS